MVQQAGNEADVLYGGTLAGQHQVLLSNHTYIDVSNIVAGRLLATYDPRRFDGPTRRVTLIDVITAKRRVLVRNDPALVWLAIAPNGTEWYWVRRNSTGIDGVWRQPLRGGSPERVTRGWRCSWDSFGSCRGGMVFSADGNWLAVSGFNAPVHIIDTSSSAMTVVPVRKISDLLGFIGDEVIIDVYQPCNGSASALARTVARVNDCGAGALLDAIDVRDGSRRQLVDRGGGDAEIYRSKHGSVLVRDGPDAAGWSQVWAVGAGDRRDRPLYRAKVGYSFRWLQGTVKVGLGSFGESAIEIADWVPILMDRRATGSVPTFGGILVNIHDGTVVQVPTIGP